MVSAYDYIQVPLPGQPISSSLYGVRVRDSILDLDRRLSAYDASTGSGKVYAASNLVLATTTETAALTIPGFVVQPGYAYECTMRMGLLSATAGNLVNMRIRKNTVGGTDWGEYYRFEGKGTAPTMSAIGTIYLLNNTLSAVTADVVLTATCSGSGAAYATLVGLTNSPRFFTIRPAGFASDYLGMGVAVS